MAETLAFFYDDISESQADEVIRELALATNTPNLTLGIMRKRVLAASCIPHYIRKLIRCPSCGRWQMTDHIFCPQCSGKEDVDWGKCQLAHCINKNCCGNDEVIKRLSAEERRRAVCHHLSRKAVSEYIFYIPPEPILAEFIRSRCAFRSVGLTESEIVKGVKSAEQLHFHSLLYSENACDVYEAVGWKQACDAADGAGVGKGGGGCGVEEWCE